MSRRTEVGPAQAASDRGRASDADVAAIVSGAHDDPFRILGLHEIGQTWVARTFITGADHVSAHLLDGTPIGKLAQRDPAGFFEGEVKLPGRQPIRYQAANAQGKWNFVDPYVFGPVLGPLDDYYGAEGTHLRLYDKLGAHTIRHEGVEGVVFALWAPNARRVSVVGDFNAWDGRRHVMRKRMGSGLWEIFVPGLAEGAVYKYELIAADGRLLPLKSDPYGFAAEVRPKSASIVARVDSFEWQDAAYLAQRSSWDARRVPAAIYEVHLGSWRRGDDGAFLGYDELAECLIPYARDMGFSHIELLPVTEHPFDPSWGYQPTGLFAPTSRFGTPAGFARFVDKAHQAGLGVILDWVPAHFPTDEHGLARFDGTALYEHDDPRRGFHPDWNTAIYNFGRREVASFLINDALFWLERYHVDGLRVDAVASMLYLDYSRKEGEWLPNAQGGRENLEAVAFLRRMNEACYGLHPCIMTIAEESTAWPSVSKPVFAGGLGFGFKWNMGFMHDTLAYLAREPIHRRFHHSEITFGLLYAFSENFVLPLSHDEVVHGKRSLLEKMAGDEWQKFAALRAYYAFMWGYPGKKLLFMGQEFAQRREWSEGRSLDWHLLEQPSHAGVKALVADLNRLYREMPALHARDCEVDGFEWLIVDDAENSIFAWLRKSGDSHPPVAVVTNFTPVPRDRYLLPLPRAGLWRERLNTDANIYGGSGHGNLGAVTAGERSSHGKPASAEISVPPMATIFLEYAGN
jgi:1,4-alpha-glucan branching enzyme